MEVRAAGQGYDRRPVRWTSIDDLAGTVDDLIVSHDRLARTLGEWCRVTDDPTLAPLLAGDAAQHAWHAGLWRARRPSTSGHDTSATGAAPAGAQPTPEQLAATYGPQLDALVERVERLLAAIDPAVDAPTARTVELVLADLRAQRRRAVARGLGTS